VKIAVIRRVRVKLVEWRHVLSMLVKMRRRFLNTT
jgi:hypothetical protein